MDFFLGGEGRLVPRNAAVALIIVDDKHYLLQLRDQKPDIFYPGHWGSAERLRHRKILPPRSTGSSMRSSVLTRRSAAISRTSPSTMDTMAQFFALFYGVKIAGSVLTHLLFREGAEMRAFPALELLNMPRVVPYDSFAVWLHASDALKA